MDSSVRNLIIFSARLLVKHQCKDARDLSYERAEIPLPELDDELIEQVQEDFLESVFGTESKITRKLFL